MEVTPSVWTLLNDACRTCTDGVTQAPTTPWLIEVGLPTEGAIAHVLVSKYADHTPFYRQSQILACSGIDIHRSTLADWVGVAAFHLRPVVDRLAEHLKTSTKLFMDETTAPILDPGRGKTKTGYLWALARDDRAWGGDDPPGVVYFYPALFDEAMVRGSPEPARRYFTYAIRPRTTPLPVVEIEMTGQCSLGTKDGPRYQPMRARQILAAPEGFVWAMRTTGRMPGCGIGFGPVNAVQDPWPHPGVSRASGRQMYSA